MEEIDHLGDRLFGRALRLRVARWVLLREDPVFFQSEVSKGVEYNSPSAVTEELGRLVELGMISKAPKTASDRRQYYRREEDSSLWQVIEAAVYTLGETVPRP